MKFVFICSLDDMHDLQVAPSIVKSCPWDTRVTFPPWFGETLSHARVALGMKWKWTPGAVSQAQAQAETGERLGVMGGGLVGGWVTSPGKQTLAGFVKDSCV